MRVNSLTVPSSTRSLAQRGVGAIFGLGLLVLSAGCGTVSEVLPDDSEPIAELAQMEPDATVSLRGTVGDRVPLVAGGVYLLQDETGEVWVLSSESLPDSGAQLQVSGTLRDRSIPINGVEYGDRYLEEQERQVR